MISMTKKLGLYALGMMGLLIGSNSAHAFGLPHPHPHCPPPHHHHHSHYHPSFGISLGIGYRPIYRPSVIYSSPVVVSSPVVYREPVVVSSPVIVDNSAAEQAEYERKLQLENAKVRRKDAEKRVEKYQKELRNQDKIEGQALGMTGGQIDDAAPGAIDAAYSAKYGRSEARTLIERYLSQAVNDLNKANADIAILKN